MSGATTELNLRTAVDADDNADYLTLDLANSLRTVDALFNNVTGHTHVGAHQGGPLLLGANQIADGSITSPKIADGSIQTVDLADHSVTSVKLAPPIDIAGYFRTTLASPLPTSGVGLEMYYQAGNGGVIQTFDRTATTYGPTLIIGSIVQLRVGGTVGLTVNADGSVNTAGALTLGVGTINLAANMVITNDANNIFYRATAAGNHFFQHTDGSYAGVLCLSVTASGAVSVGTTLTTTGNISAPNITFSQNGYYWQGVASIGVVETNGGIQVDGGLVYFHTNRTVYLQLSGTTLNIVGFTNVTMAAAAVSGPVTATRYQSAGAYYFAGDAANLNWDGTYIRPTHSFSFNTTGNQIVWPNGSYISGNSGYVQGSQRALKENVTPVPDSTLIARVADPVMTVNTYSWPGDTRESLGFMAEDVATVLPNYVIRDEDGTPVGYNPQELTAILWGAVRALDARVRTLEAA